jgi:hypothetical protein
MKLESLPYYIRSRRQDDLVVEFDDGDRYPVWTLDMSGENPVGECEISVWFKDCIGDSKAQTHALEAGSLKKSPPGTLVVQRDAEETCRNVVHDSANQIDLR